MLTVRNWMTGYYIVEYEQRGKNRAEYGTNLLGEMAEKLDIKGLDRTHLNLCRIFYIKYPQICATVSHKLKGIGESILLCTKKGQKMVEYALSGMDNQLFVSQYMLQLPDKKQLEDFLIKEMDELGME